MHTATIQFKNSTRAYSYLVPASWKVQRQDYLVVLTPNSGYELVTVCSVYNGVTKAATKRAVCKVDTSEYHAWVKAEDERKKREEKKAKLRQEAAERFNQITREEAMRQAAKTDNVLADLLKQIEEL